MDPLLSTEEVGRLIGRPARTLRQWRYVGTGPKYIKVGQTVRYRPADVETWLEAQTKDPTDHQEGTTA